MSIIKGKGIGSSLESFLQEEGIFEEVRLKALKTALTLQLKDVMKKNNSTLSDLARKMGTSRAVVQRLLNPNNTSITLSTLDKAAYALGRKLIISFE